jgi:hypothetical protein
MRAAQVAARYTHRPADAQVPVELVEDEFGFKIDPQVARTIRAFVGECGCLANTSEPSPADVQKHRGLLKCLHEQIATVGCSQVYGWADLRNDETRLKEIQEQKSRRKLSPEVDAEEAYLIARVEAFRASPTHQAWCRVSELEVSRANGKTLPDAEISELSTLRARFPTVARQFANRDWSQYIWEGFSFKGLFTRDKSASTRDDPERQNRQREAELEWRERHKVSQRQIDYMAKRLEWAKSRPPVFSFKDLQKLSSTKEK